ncbi:hypothetical protein MTO96_048775 [Rhipicephalus appendiculatus]
MKFSSASLLCALLSAFLALPTDAARSEGEEGRLVFGRGCPDLTACEASCRKLNKTHGICTNIRNTCICV